MKLGLRPTPRPRADPGHGRQPQGRKPVPGRHSHGTYDFSAGPEMRIQKHLIGHEANPILIVDGLLANPASAIEFAEAEVRYVAGPAATYYPGTRGRGSDGYVATFLARLEGPIRDVFGLAGNVRFAVDNMFSLTTTAPTALRPLQKVPHVDTVGPRGVAVVHFLFDRPLGGTGFFRHKATGWESIDEERSERYERLVAREIEEGGAPKGYLVDDSRHFERTFNVEPAMDRLVLFSGHLLHGATVPDGVELTPDPRHGRLTVNSFINFS